MKILYITERFAPFVGGIETMSEHLLAALSAAGHDLRIVTSHSDVAMPDTEEWHGIPLYRLPMLTSLTNRDLAGIFRARATLRNLKATFAPDVVHIQFSGPSAMFHWDTQDNGTIPTLVTVHSVAGNLTANRSLYLDTVRRADWVASVSRHMLDWTLQHAPEISERSSVVYNGVPDLIGTNAGAPNSLGPPTVLWIGRMVAWKRVDRLIAAIARLAPTHKDLRLVLAGDGPERKRLEAMAVDAGIADQTHFTGWVDATERSKLMSQATLIAIPSEGMENLPMVALEAASHGRPIVGARVSGLPEIVEHQRSGLLIADLTPETLADAIASVVTDPVKAQSYGNAAKQIIEDRFTSCAMVQAYQQIYARIVQREKASS